VNYNRRAAWHRISREIIGSNVSPLLDPVPFSDAWEKLKLRLAVLVVVLAALSISVFMVTR
jgi:hypothetical protein